MILPIYAYGQPVLKKVATPITADYTDLATLIANMWETMYQADGVGLAAPQIGLSIRLFVIDTLQLERKKDEIEETDKGFKKTFINAEMLEETGDPWAYEEGCLSIPRIRGDVERPAVIRLRYQNEQFETFEETFSGIDARVIQHEYDHIQGILFTERLKPLKKRLIQRKMDDIRQGKVNADYRMRFFSGR
ncbi:MAG TPA: peptide deformylase [Saprospiraceae bacterium]|nr:peptide deformylase [Saprospiraceae bacterium]HPI06296.1 peptide deformylase [Saprospiraceae bacterium]